MNIFRQAHKNLPLSPTERAFLKFVYMTIGSAALTGAVAAAQYIATNSHNINWSTVWTVFIAAFGLTIIETGRKYVTAHSDGPLGAAQQLLSTVLQRTGEQVQGHSPTTKTPASSTTSSAT